MKAAKPQGLFCQSCAMPMQKPGDFGTNADGSKNQEYCQYCYQKGKFTEPNITMEQMIEKCTGIMKQMQVTKDQIEKTRLFIPTLKRWRK
jgi:hypothetical protein